MPSKWDEEEKRTDDEPSTYYPEVKRPAKTATQPFSDPTRDLAHFPSWQRWGLPAGLTLGILIGLIVGYIIIFGYVLG